MTTFNRVLDGVVQSKIAHRLTGNSMSYCGCGWIEILDETEEALRKLDSPRYNVEIDAIRSVVGALSISLASNEWITELQWREAYRICIKAEVTSMQICEACGEPAELRRKRNWFSTVCWNCDPDMSNIPVNRVKYLRVLED